MSANAVSLESHERVVHQLERDVVNARADATREERARIVAMLRREADGRERAYPNGDEYADGHVAGFRAMADRIERGET